jgi:hypothetical protein
VNRWACIVGAPTPIAADNDTIARNRACPVVAPSAIPAPPAGYRPSPGEVRKNDLRRIDGGLESELIEALDTCGARGPQLTEDLGRHAPVAGKAQELAARLKTVRRTKAAVAHLLGYLNEVEDIALSDSVVLLEAVERLCNAALPHDPGLALIYAPVLELFEARAAKISEGRAQAKARLEAEKKA